MRKVKRRKTGGRNFARGNDTRRHVLTPAERAKGRETWARKNLFWGDYDRYFASLDGGPK